MIAEALLYTRPGLLELLPALPRRLARGGIKGVRGRNRILIEDLTWDIAAHTATAILVSDITQDITLVCRRGITGLTAISATASPSPLGDHARTVHLTAGARTVITVKLHPTRCRVVNRRSGKVLDVSGAATRDGAPVIQWAWSGAANQRWNLLPGYDGSFRLSNLNSGKVLDNPGASSRPGRPLDQWTDTDSPNQGWQLKPAPTSGYYHLVNAASGLNVDIENAAIDDGTPIVQSPANGTAAQDWRIETLGE